MRIRELLTASRSYRRFHEDRPLDEESLLELVRLAQLCPSAANRQPLKYAISWTADRNAAVFPHLRWAAALADWPGPAEGERPTGYVVILGDTRVAKNFYCDHGIVAQSMLLAAAEQGLGGCMIGSINRAALGRALQLADHIEILLVVALGHPAETVVLEPDTPPDEVPYWRDADGVHHVPKRAIREVVISI